MTVYHITELRKQLKKSLIKLKESLIKTISYRLLIEESVPYVQLTEF